MKLDFINDDDKNVTIELNGESYGKLKFDSDKGVWVLWPGDIDDGVSYFESLNETTKTIRDELQNAESEGF